MNEIWKDIIWYEWLYQVSNLGNVKSLFRYKKILSPSKWRYLRVSLTKESVTKDYSIHRLVAQTFIQNPENKKEVNHINWIKYDNRLHNLEWCTRSENEIHSHAVLWKISGKERQVVYQYDSNAIFVKKYESQSLASKETWIPQQNISRCLKWLTMKAWWFFWNYINPNK